jgi:hypothetical protein
MQFIYFYLISYSLIGYGIILSSFLDIKKNHFGYLGLLGLTFFLIISFISSLLIKHGYYSNILFLSIGLILFITLRNRINELKKNFFNHLLIFLLLFIFISVGKNHDDFPYYHFPYISILTEFSHPFGLGLLNNGFRSPSSIFFLGSMFYLPGIGVYLFHITPAIILGFANLILLKKIFDKNEFDEFKFDNLISLISFIFINIFFYRLAEHGTDRSGMILVIVSIIIFLKVINFKTVDISDIKFLIIILCFAITLKPFYLINIPLIFLLLLYDKTRSIFLNLFFSKTFWYCFLLIFFIVFYTFINSGCLFFPLTFTCFKNLPWTLDIGAINDISIWFELWSKAGASPNYIVNDRLSYISELNWLTNWISNYFFNKVSDYLLSLIFLLLILFIVFRNNLIKKKNNFKFFYLYFFLIIFLIEWFLYHPALRYGGYHLIYLIIFIPFSIYLSNFNISYKIFKKKAVILILIAVIIFTFRNFNRLHHEYKRYNYNPITNSNYKFIGGDKKFYYRYNSHIKDRINNYNSFDFLGKKFLYLSRENF